LTDEIIKWYIDVIERELIKLREGKFTGNINFQVNYKSGGIANMNGGLNRSWKKPE
jgi:hypothetical protein